MAPSTEETVNDIIRQLDQLKSEKVLSASDYDRVVEILHKTKDASSGALATASQKNDVFVSRYDFPGNNPTDLPLRSGERVEVIERLNNDWWRGRLCDSGREGVFPSNYVVPEGSSGSSDTKGGFDSSVAPPSYYGQAQGYGQAQPYGQPPQAQFAQPPQPFQPQQYYAPNNQMQQFQNYGPPQQQGYQPPAPYYPPQEHQVQQAQPQQQQQQGGGQGQMGDYAKRFGKRFGDAAIFGAGATLGSDIMNKIF